jgi:hypothetical protein
MLSCSYHNCASYSGYFVIQSELLHHCNITGMSAGWRIQHVQLQCRAGSRPAHNRPCRDPHPSQERGCLGGGKSTKKVNTIVLELECLVTEQGQQQIFSFQAGQPGGSSRNQISSSKYVPVCTCLYPPQTLMYSEIHVCTCMYRHVPCCTILYSHVPRIPVLVCIAVKQPMKNDHEQYSVF